MLHKLMGPWRHLAWGIFVLCAATGIGLSTALGQTTTDTKIEETALRSSATNILPHENPLRPPDTSSPRATIRSFVHLTKNLEDAYAEYRIKSTRANGDRIKQLVSYFSQLFDLSQVPVALRHEIGRDTALYLLDIIGRLELPPIDSIPDEDTFASDKEPPVWRIPNTRITLKRQEAGPNEGEFLFSDRTVELVPHCWTAWQRS